MSLTSGSLPSLPSSASLQCLSSTPSCDRAGYAPVIGVFSAALLLFDNAHVAQDRLILLDAPLILFMMLSLYSYIRFYKLRYNEFTAKWWFWLVAPVSISP